jgi:predicted nucleic acid-binding protein
VARPNLPATDAVSFVLMTQRKITKAFTFDAHFATAGFRIVG